MYVTAMTPVVEIPVAKRNITLPTAIPSRHQWRMLEELSWWLALATMTFSLLVPLFALDSLASAEIFLRLGVVHQLIIFGMILVASFLLANRALLQSWNKSCLAGLLGVLLAILSLQPSGDCCSVIAAFCAGMLPADQLSISDVIFYLMPILGGLLVIIQIQISRVPQGRRR